MGVPLPLPRDLTILTSLLRCRSSLSHLSSGSESHRRKYWILGPTSVTQKQHQNVSFGKEKVILTGCKKWQGSVTNTHYGPMLSTLSGSIHPDWLETKLKNIETTDPALEWKNIACNESTCCHPKKEGKKGTRKGKEKIFFSTVKEPRKQS